MTLRMTETTQEIQLLKNTNKIQNRNISTANYPEHGKQMYSH